MHLKKLELNGFKSFAKKSEFVFDVPIIAIVGPNGSGKSNIVESIRFVLGEQSVKSMRGKTGSDLIFKGSSEISKMSRASVSIIFDNTDRVFSLHQLNNTKLSMDFDEINITREVYVDGTNKYMINGNEVRMKDIHELIASVNIGASGHHIISQGEADRYLNANVKDRRELIEEALGLKLYQYRIKESEHKLKKSEENMRESELLRREIAPHLKFLKRQVDKIEKAKNLRSELAVQYQDYFAQEDYLIKRLSSQLDIDRSEILKEYEQVQSFLKEYGDPQERIIHPEENTIIQKQQHLKERSTRIISMRQELGRIEGMISLLERQQNQKPSSEDKPKTFAYTLVKDFLSNVVERIDKILRQESADSRDILNSIRSDIERFTESNISSFVQIDNSKEIEELQDKNSEFAINIDTLQQEEQVIQSEISELQKKVESLRIKERESQRQYYEFFAKKRELDVKRELITTRDDSLGSRSQARMEEHQEAKILLGIDAIEFQPIMIEHEMDISPRSQEQSRRELERIKIRLEDMGGVSGIETITEYNETLERDKFLEGEIIDIEETIDSLRTIISDLKETLDTEFNKGIKKINTEFDRFFKLMFGGGQARLDSALVKKRRKKSDNGDNQMSLILEDNETKEYGIDIKVQLPRKKVSDLDMLSGGERSLTSIALLFALSQVNPPPFLVLDETDAALDEANSQRYGDMVEQLSKYSQLIVVSHNRETMSRAQTLFGVTLGRDDCSTTLSLRLEDAENYAK
jgi:chromosome segregation protein